MTANDSLEPIAAGSGERKRRIGRFLLWTLFAAVCIFLRVWRLDTDAYRGLSTDPGLFTDEGFYTHAARNVTLFGRARTDDFNNSLLMPTLHYLQVFVFRWFCYGILQARFLSITLGLLTLSVFYAAMKRAFGAVSAVYAVVFLGLEHVPLLYSRMALMDTAAAFLLVCAFYAFTVALTNGGRRAAIGAAVCGLTLGLLYATRGLAAVGIAAPFIALLLPLSAGAEAEKRAGRRKFALATFAGLLMALFGYGILWYLPHRAELAHVTRFHLRGQLLPHSARELGSNLWRAASDIRLDGLLPYLVVHSPVLLILTVSIPFFRKNKARLSDVEARCVIYLAAWLMAFSALFAFASYAPSRYYVLFYPALCGLAGVGVVRATKVTATKAQSVPSDTQYTSNTTPALSPRRRTLRLCDCDFSRPNPGAIIIAIWAIINIGWYADWARNLTTTQKNASETLARTLPPNSVLLGDSAPGLGIYNGFVTVNVMPGLCNDREPSGAMGGASALCRDTGRAVQKRE